MKGDMESIYFDVYGFRIEVKSTDTKILDGLSRDYAYFSCSNTHVDTYIEIYDSAPDYHTFPDIKSSIHTLDYISYNDRNVIYTDYHGKAVRKYNKKENLHKIFADDYDLRYEISYLTVLTCIGRQLDKWHIHRIHALGLSKNNKAILIILPEKGGKTTLALQLIKNDNLKLISEDSPLISKNGEILPFPLRLGILPGGETNIPTKYLRNVRFKRVGPKLLVDIDYFEEKISTVTKPGIILIGERVLGCKSEIRPIGKIKALRELVKSTVIGLGLAQGLEYMFSRDLSLILADFKLAYSRFVNCNKLLYQSTVYKYVIGHNTDINTKTLIQFLDNSTDFN